jgi:hypothetical protein
MANVFISYAREDRITALRLYHDLKQRGYEPWIDRYQIRPGENWEANSRRALHESSHVVVLLSRCSVGQRGEFQAELKEALEILKKVPEKEIFLIPARLEECELPAFALQQIHYVDLFPEYEVGILEILAALSSDAERRQRLDPEFTGALQLFRRGLFEEAARRFSALIRREPQRSDLRYYLVLSYLAGKRVKLLASDVVMKLEEHLRVALAIEFSPHTRWLCALIKYDYYVLNGLREPWPTIDHLLEGDLQIGPDHAAELRAAVSAPGNPLWETLVHQVI